MPAYDYQCALCDERKTVYRHYYLGDVIEPKCECQWSDKKWDITGL